MKEKTVHFTIGEGMEQLVRDAYWFENRREWALRLVKDLCVGISDKQITSILDGEAKIMPVENGTMVELVYEEDKNFKKKLWQWKDFEKNKGGYWTPNSLKEDHRKGDDCILCKCGHPRYMHHETSSGEYLQCKVHGCRHDNNPCPKFRPVKKDAVYTEGEKNGK